MECLSIYTHIRYQTMFDGCLKREQLVCYKESFGLERDANTMQLLYYSNIFCE